MTNRDEALRTVLAEHHFDRHAIPARHLAKVPDDLLLTGHPKRRDKGVFRIVLRGALKGMGGLRMPKGIVNGILPSLRLRPGLLGFVFLSDPPKIFDGGGLFR